MNNIQNNHYQQAENRFKCDMAHYFKLDIGKCMPVFAIFTNKRLFGLAVALSYILIIIFIWVYANIRGYTYFTAGEPVWWIKYLEWIFGVYSIYTLSILIKEECDK